MKTLPTTIVILGVLALQATAQQWPADAEWFVSQAAPEPTGAVEGSPPATTGQAGHSEPNPGQFKLKVYGWVFGMDGNAGRGAGDVDVDYCDTVEAIDKIKCMVPVNLETRFDRLGFIGDYFYVRLEDSVSGPLASANVTAEQHILDLAAFIRLGAVSKEAGGSSLFALDVLAGARYNRLSGAIGIQSPGDAVRLSRSEEWWDGFAGLRGTWWATDSLTLFVRGDVGGFGIGSSSDLTWQIIAGAEFHITDNSFVELGYRLIDTDYDQGSGDDRFVYDILMQGPYLAIGVDF